MTPRSILSLFLSILSISATACASRPEAPASATAASPPAKEAAPAPAAEPSSPGKPPEPRKERKPFDLYNACMEVVTVALGDDPKGTSAGRRTIAPTSSVDLPREADGNQRVWLLDGKGEPLVDVRVTRGMKRVEIGRSCRTLDAR